MPDSSGDLSDSSKSAITGPCGFKAVTMRMAAYVSIHQHTSAYVSIRQHTSAYVSDLEVEGGDGAYSDHSVGHDLSGALEHLVGCLVGR